MSATEARRVPGGPFKATSRVACVTPGFLLASRRLAWAWVLALGGSMPAWANPPGNASASPNLSESDIRRATQSQPFITDADIERARRQHSFPGQTAPATPPPRSTPRTEALPKPVADPRRPAAVDLDALAQHYQSTGRPTAPALPAAPALLVFVSLAMPEPTLERLIDQAARARAALLLRGLHEGSLTRTAARASQLIGRRQVDLRIDPETFDRYGITRVPSFVLLSATEDRTGCSPQACGLGDKHLMLRGDVSLDHALEVFQRQSPANAFAASGFLRRLGK